MTEAQIIEGCRRRRPVAQRKLVERYSPMLMTVARRYSADRLAAEDLLQDTLVRILENMHKYRPTGSFVAWQRRILINLALQRLDKRALRRVQPLPEEGAALAVDPAVFSHLAAEQLLQLIERLPDGYRAIFNLYAIEGYAHREIAELLSISESTSRSQYSRARQLLQQYILHHETESCHVRR